MKFKAAKNKDKFLRDNPSLESDVMLHETAKRYFDDYIKNHGKPLPSMKVIIEEINSLKALQRKKQQECNSAKSEHWKMMKLSSNLQAMLGKEAIKSTKRDNFIEL